MVENNDGKKHKGFVWVKALGEYVSREEIRLKKTQQKARWKKIQQARKHRRNSGRR